MLTHQKLDSLTAEGVAAVHVVSMYVSVCVYVCVSVCMSVSLSLHANTPET